MFTGLRWCDGVIQVAPISSRLCAGSIARYEVEPTIRPVFRSIVAKGRTVPLARPASDAATNARIAASVSSENGKKRNRPWPVPAATRPSACSARSDSSRTCAPSRVTGPICIGAFYTMAR